MNQQTFVQSRSNGSTPIRVLMADPDPSVAPVYREPLMREGFELATATSGLECVARLRQRVPDVLVLEPQMPWGGGEGVLAIMDESLDLAMVPVMILTACRDPHVLKRVERFSISDYHVKPLVRRSTAPEASQFPRSSPAPFHVGRPRGASEMRHRTADRRPHPRPARRGLWRANYRLRLHRIVPRQATGRGRIVRSDGSVEIA